MARITSSSLESPRILYRRELRKKLSGILETPLFFVVAGMGYGKSTAVRDFVRFDDRIASISQSESGSDSVRKFLKSGGRLKYIWFSFHGDQQEDMWMWVRFSKLVEKTNRELSRRLIEYGMPYNRYDMDRLEGMIREVIDSETVVVFDDMHSCESSYIRNLIKHVAEKKIPHLHIVVISREYPRTDVTELLSTGQARILTQKDFTFSKTECADFFILNDASLQPEEREELWQITGGWASHLYMALMYYRTYGTFQNMPKGPELMRRAIYDNFDEKTQRSLMILSRVQYFTPDQAEILTGNKNIRNVLASMYKGYCFTKFDEESGSYSFHSILSNMLDMELKKSDIDENDIFEKQGLWCMASDDSVGALRAFAQCHDYERILSIMAEPNSAKLMTLARNIIIKAFKSMDMRTKLSNPIGYLSFIYAYSINVNIAEGMEMLARAKDYYSDPQKSPDLSERNQVMGEIAMIESIKAFNDLDAMFRCYEKAYEYFDGGSSLIYSSDTYITFGIPLTMFLYHRRVGGLERMVSLVENEFWIYNHIANGSGTGFEYLLRSEYEFKQGNFDEAEMLAYKAVYKGRMRDQCDIILSASFVLLRISLINCRYREVNETLLLMMQEVESNGSSIMLGCYEFILGYVCSFLGKFELVPSWLNEDSSGSKFMAISRNSAYIIRGKYLSEIGKFDELLELSDRMLPVYESHSSVDGVIIFRVFRAIALYHVKGSSAGINDLKIALDMAEKDGICVTIGENTYEVIPMLEMINTPFSRKVLDYAHLYINAKNNWRNRSKHEELTKRETEVMDLVCDGLTGEAIAEKLFISHSTVKKHMSNIYQKLGVNKKADAIAEYRKRRSRSHMKGLGWIGR